jgi:hypothetical protein
MEMCRSSEHCTIYLSKFTEKHKQIHDTCKAQKVLFFLFFLLQILDEQIMELAASHQVGPLLLLTETLKSGLMSETKSWKLVYGRALNQTCAAEMDVLFEFFGSMQKRLSRPVKDLDDIRALMSAMTEIREAEIRIDLTIIPVEEAYTLLIRHSIVFDDGNAERVDSLGYGWRLLQQKVNIHCPTKIILQLVLTNNSLINMLTAVLPNEI